MLKLENILETLKRIEKEYNNEFKLGVAGSYSRGEATEESDLDIVIDGDSTRIDFSEYIKSQFDIEVDTLWLDLLKNEDENLDKFLIEEGLSVNDYSIYKNIMKGVKWV